MTIAPRWLGLHLALLGAATLSLMAGCTLSGSRGIGDVTPVPEGEVGVPSPTSPALEAPTPIPPTATPTLSDLEVLGTEAAVTATAQASGAVGGETEEETGQATPGAVVTSEIGGEIPPPTNTPLGTPSAGTAACPPTHTVAQGENLFRIALRYGITYQELAAANGIANPNQISVGLVLNIPGCGPAPAPAAQGAPAAAPGTHVVQPGENLFRIALQYNMTWTALAAANGITNPDLVVAGQVLQIPQ